MQVQTIIWQSVPFGRTCCKDSQSYPPTVHSNDVVLTCGDVSFDTKSRKAIVGGEPLPLTRKETGILEYLMVNRGRPISQEEFIEHVWDNSVDNFSNSIRVHISALRKKLRTSLGYDPIRNRIGEGYVMGEEE